MKTFFLVFSFQNQFDSDLPPAKVSFRTRPCLCGCHMYVWIEFVFILPWGLGLCCSFRTFHWVFNIGFFFKSIKSMKALFNWHLMKGIESIYRLWMITLTYEKRIVYTDDIDDNSNIQACTSITCWARRKKEQNTMNWFFATYYNGFLRCEME